QPPIKAMETLWECWQEGDEFVRRVMDQVFDQLAWAAGLAVNMIDPQEIVVAGYVLQGRPAWVEEIKRRADRWVIHSGQRKLRVVESRATLTDILQTAALQHFYRPL